jgi:hypothetical protein
MRAAVIALWSLLCFAVAVVWWFGTIYDLHANPDVADPDTSVAIAGCIIAGCTGGGWLCGMLVLALLVVIFRR